MACINPDGTLSVVAAQILSHLSTHGPSPIDSLTTATGLPLYRVRATLRETGDAGLVEALHEEWRLTALGIEALDINAG